MDAAAIAGWRARYRYRDVVPERAAPITKKSGMRRTPLVILREPKIAALSGLLILFGIKARRLSDNLSNAFPSSSLLL
jgi:hypothetical protein